MSDENNGIVTTIRQCIKCGAIKPVTEFRDYWYARTNVCKACKATYLRERHESIRMAQKQAALDAYLRKVNHAS